MSPESARLSVKVNHYTLSDFRVEHGEAMKQLFEQVLMVLLMKRRT